jgi:hypothetical protein
MSIDQNTNEGKKPRAPKISKYLWLASLLVSLTIPIVLLMDYVGGYEGFPLVIPCCFLPADSIPVLFGLILTFYVIIRSIWSAIKLRKLTLSLLLIPLTISLWFVWVIPLRLIPLRNSPFLLGFKHRILSISSPAELHEFAAKAREILPTDISFPSAGMQDLLEGEENRALWNQMSKYKILTTFDARVYISTANHNYVELAWGNVFTGSWGIRIASQPFAEDRDNPYFILIDPNIAIFKGN